MCGRYALVLRPSVLRQRLRDYGLPIDEPDPAPLAQKHKPDIQRNSGPPENFETQQLVEGTNDTEGTRQSYNIAPGYIEPVYRAVIPQDGQSNLLSDGVTGSDVKYVVQGMKWGLIPSWSQQNPDYRTIMKTINCRDDSLQNYSGMWTSIKKKKRCIVLAEGFFEWRKQGDKKVPYYVKRQDGHLMFMAGLWDCVTLPDITTSEPSQIYTYTIITVSSNSQIQFLHDRMPAFLTTPEEILAWLDPTTTTWSSALQNLLRPFSRALEIYPVPKEVGKVGNNDKSFVLPLDSKENRANIKNWFGAVGSIKTAGVKRKSNDVSEDDRKEGIVRDSEASLEWGLEDREHMESHTPRGIKSEIPDDQKEINRSELSITWNAHSIPPPDSSTKDFENKPYTEAFPSDASNDTGGMKHGATTHRRQTSPRLKIALPPKKGNKSKKVVSTNGNMKITNFFPK